MPYPDELATDRVCIIGAGPAGITLAAELGAQGTPVVLVESGGKDFSSEVQHLADCNIVDASRHAPMHEATRRQLGGTSAIWGGRCVPLDTVDFEQRDYVPFSGWPIPAGELSQYYERACRYCLCGESRFSVSEAFLDGQPSMVPGLPDGDVLSSSLERWSLPLNFWHGHRDELNRRDHVSILTGFTCIAMNYSGGGDSPRVESVTLKRLDGNVLTLKANLFVVACGGLESTRLLLDGGLPDMQPESSVGKSLGRNYMGHISGKIASIRFDTDPKHTVYGYEKDDAGVYCKRRFTISEQAQRRECLLNFAAWLDHPPIGDAGHGNGILSLAYLCLSLPYFNRFLAPEAIIRYARESGRHGGKAAHIKNVLFDLPAIVRFLPGFVANKYFSRRRLPGPALYSTNNVYALHYHAEQAPNPDSRVYLSDARDALGRRKLIVDLKFSEVDVDSVVRCHALLDTHLREHGVGRLIYHCDDLSRSVAEQARDGIHQIGTTRMSESSESGVVDKNLKVHGCENLFVLSSSVFPTSGQANPTLTIVTLAIRLAAFLKGTP